MFERFTHRARQALTLAQEEAKGLGHNFLGTEHILLGLIAEGGGVACRVLRDMGVEYEPTRQRVVSIVGLGARRALDSADAHALATIGIDLDEVVQAAQETFGPDAFERALERGRSAGKAKPPRSAPRAKRVIETSLREALDLGHNYIGTEHILLALCRLEGGVAVLALARLGVDREDVRARVIEELSRLSA